MLRDGLRRCDLCQREIAKGERYAVRRFERSEIPQGFSHRDGPIVIDICRDCQNRMGLVGETAID